MGRFRLTFSALRGLARAYRGSQRGNVATLFALMLPLVAGGAGFGVETTYWYLTRLQMQNAADAAAYTAAMDMRTGASSEEVETAAILAAEQNGFDTDTGLAEVNTPPTSGGGGDQAVEVILNRDIPRVFTALFIPDDVALRARAVAQFSNAGDACILALNPTASKAALFSGSSDLKLTGCSVMANSIAADAITAQGSAKVSTQCMISGGGVSLNANVAMECGSAITQASPVADPFRLVAAPEATGGCLNDNGGNRSPGRYCGGMNLKNNVTLQSGVYVVSGGDFKINANANVQGVGVTIYLASGSNVSLNGNAQVQLSAPVTGSLKGMLFFGDRSGSGKNIFNGTAASKLTGAIYFKSQEVDYLGNFSGHGGCTQVVADKVEWSGNTSASADCSAYGMGAIPARLVVRLME